MSSPNVTIILKLLADKSRMTILDILMDGRAYTVNEITSFTKIKQHTVSYHLKLLTEANLTSVKKYGKFHYYSISDTLTPELFEMLSQFSPMNPTKSYRQHVQKKEIKRARTCYDHLAGELGVEIRDFLTSKNIIVTDSQNKDKYIVSPNGKTFFKESLNINIEELQKKKRNFCINCLDWSERKNHIAGSLAKAIFDFLIEKKYIIQNPGTRAITITTDGENFFKNSWHITLSDE
ncbi:ArsR/SmtB family transcription factor [Streptococcus pluranimalium]